jgi:UDP-glucose 4-epimerase
LRAIVTGGAGFIGSHVVDALLARGDEVLVLDDLSNGKRENVPEGARLEVMDVREPLDAHFEGAEECFHLAAQVDVRVSVERPADDAATNVLGTIRVLEAARQHGTQVVFSSTGGAIYGECSRPAREDDPLAPLSPYGTAKLAAESYISMWNRLHGTHHTVLRYANVYGPRQDAELEGGVVAIFFERFRNGDRATVYGDGKQTRDFLHVSDIVAATLAAAENEGLFSGELWVATNDDRVVGFVAVRDNEITWLYVDPAYHRQGFGRALLIHAVERCGPVARTETLVGNEPALVLYRSERFAVVETRSGRLTGNERFAATGHLLERAQGS